MKLSTDIEWQDIKRFLKRVLILGGDDCWEWQGGRNNDGYGQFAIKGKYVSAHRLALSLHLGRPLASGQGALHTCDNPRCCNPSHLFEGTQSDNMKDRSAKGRAKGAKGSRNSKSKLVESDVILIRQILARDSMSISQVCKRFKVTRETIIRVRDKKSWTHI